MRIFTNNSKQRNRFKNCVLPFGHFLKDERWTNIYSYHMDTFQMNFTLDRLKYEFLCGIKFALFIKDSKYLQYNVLSHL